MSRISWLESAEIMTVRRQKELMEEVKQRHTEEVCAGKEIS